MFLQNDTWSDTPINRTTFVCACKNCFITLWFNFYLGSITWLRWQHFQYGSNNSHLVLIQETLWPLFKQMLTVSRKQDINEHRQKSGLPCFGDPYYPPWPPPHEDSITMSPDHLLFSVVTTTTTKRLCHLYVNGCFWGMYWNEGVIFLERTGSIEACGMWLCSISCGKQWPELMLTPALFLLHSYTYIISVTCYKQLMCLFFRRSGHVGD